MNELLDVANAFSTPLKVSWVVWLAWGIGQVYWFKHERTNASALKTPRAPRAPRKAATKRENGVAVGRLITPQHVATAPKPATVVEQPAFAPPAYDAPVFDPAKAVVETFDPRGDTSLDAIVADMEANMRERDGSHIH